MEVQAPPFQMVSNGRSEEKITKLVGISSVIASLGGILMGYDVGVISTVILQVRDRYALTCWEQDIVVSSVLFGAFVGSIFAGSFVDRFGRRFSILGTSLLFIVGSIFLALSQNMYMLVIGRIVVGLGVALSTTAECTYISEISPKRWRGMLVSLNELGITVGFLVAYIIGHIFIPYYDGWRYMLGLAAVPAFVQLAGVICLPPSPYYLILRGNPIKAEEIIKKIHPGCDSQLVVEEITTAVLEAKCSSMCQLFSLKDNMRSRMIIGILLALLQQLTGNTNVLYFAPIIFQQFGYCSETESTLASIYLGIVKVVTAVLALLLIDRVGRRILLCAGAFAMGLSIAILGVVTVVSHAAPPENKCSKLYHDVSNDVPNVTFAPDVPAGRWVGVGDFTDQNVEQSVTTEPNIQVNVTSDHDEKCNGTTGPMWIRVISIVTLMVYISSYQFSFGIGTWLVLSEIFPSKVRGRCVGISTSATWGANFILTVTFLDTIDSMGIGYTLIMYSAVCFLSFLFIISFLPETKQKTLEEISADFNKGVRCQMNCVSAPVSHASPRNGDGPPRIRRQGTRDPRTDHPVLTPTNMPTPPLSTSTPVTRINGAYKPLEYD